MTTQNMADVAADLVAERSWAIFPGGTQTGSHGHPPGQGRTVKCQRCGKEKEPRPGWAWTKRYSSDPDVVRANFPRDANIGVVMRASGIVTIDLDLPKPGAELPEEWRIPGVNEGADVLAVLAERHGQPWPHTYMTRTGSGGLQLYYAAIAGRAIRNSASKIGPMVDVRGDHNSDGTPGGGYVLGAGSVVGGARYEVVIDIDPVPLPDWLADLIDPPQTEVTRRPPAPLAIFNGAPGGYGMKALANELDIVATARSGTRNSTLNDSAFNLGQLVGGGILARATVEHGLREAAERIGLYAEEPTKTERTIQRAIDDGMRCPRSGAA